MDRHQPASKMWLAFFTALGVALMVGLFQRYLTASESIAASRVERSTNGIVTVDDWINYGFIGRTNELLKSEAVIGEIAKTFISHQDLSPERLIEMIEVKQFRGTSLLEIRVKGPDEQLNIKISNMLAEAYARKEGVEIIDRGFTVKPPKTRFARWRDHLFDLSSRAPE